jgi:ATP-dependent helicase HrpB
MTDRLPIYEIESALATRCATHRRLLISAPTGSGKSTQIPQVLLRHNLLGGDHGQAIVLQPRRLAARLLAARVAEELGVPLGSTVGYQIRFESVAGSETRIRYATEGVVLRQMLGDPALKNVSALIFDEFHERHLYGDITLARALDLQEQSRPDLLIVVMSATLDIDAFETYLNTVRHHAAPESPPTREARCAVLTSAGRTFPVEIRHAAPATDGGPQPPVWEQAADAFAAHVRNGGHGDVLVFMPGGFEIGQTIEAIRQRPEADGFLLLPLHGELPPRDQDAAVARYQQPKVVVATNVAETSITIDGIRLVIDSGLARQARHDAQRGINTLLIEPISRAAADQRAGRAGRTAPGTVVRLWSERDHADRPPQEPPEVQRLDLSEVVLTLKASGVEDLAAFRWLEPPSAGALAHAEQLLEDLGALRRPAAATPPPAAAADATPPTALGAADGAPPAASRPSAITDLGRRMLAFPVHPRYARMLLAANEHGCVHQAALIAALTQGRDLLVRNVDKAVAEFRDDLFGSKAASDFFIWMRAWRYAAKNGFRLEACRKAGVHAATARQVGPLFDQFLRIAEREGLDVQPREVPDAALQKCVLIGFSDRVGTRLDSGTLRCELVHGRRGVLGRESVVQQAPMFVAAEVRDVEGKDQSVSTLLSLITATDPAWIEELFPADVVTQTRVYYDAAAKRVEAEGTQRFRGLLIKRARIDPPPAAEATRLLVDEVLAGRLSLPTWDHSVEQWILRLNLVCRVCPELELPPITPEDRRHLLEQLCEGASSYKSVKDRPASPVVRSWLSAAQHSVLDQQAPERLTLANKRTPKVTYTADGPPYVAMRIQELFGVRQAPKIAGGRVPVVTHVLAPNMRPVQITQDLAGFWKEQYPKLKSELQRQYPKHEWR